MKFLSYENKFGQFMSVVVDIVVLGMLWFLTSLPVITIGASSTALLYTANKTILKGEGYLFSSYFKAFAREFKQATVLWIFLLAYYAYMIIDAITTFGVNISLEDLGNGIMIFKLIVFLVITLWTQYWFAYLSKFTDKIRTILGNTLSMTFVHLLASFVLLILFVLMLVATGLAIYHFAPAVLFIPGAYACAAMFFFEKVFENYIPEDQGGKLVVPKETEKAEETLLEESTEK